MSEYIPRTVLDDSGITVEFCDSPAQIPGLRADTGVVPVHQHTCYELMLVLRGSCEHFYQHAYVPLLPGDCFLLPPDHPHAYRIRQEQIGLCFCQFEPEVLHSVPADLYQDMEFLQTDQEIERIQSLHILSSDAEKTLPGTEQGRWTHATGMMHFAHEQMEYIVSLLRDMVAEQQEHRFGFTYMKRLQLAQLLTVLRRIQMNQFGRASRQHASWKEDMVHRVVAHIESNLTHEINFKQLAQQQGITMTYFREIFKEVTGLTPVDYINRSRILFSLELLQTTDLSVSEIAMQSGILDANYFSRLFKKIVGYPPSYFKSIRADSKDDMP